MKRILLTMMLVAAGVMAVRAQSAAVKLAANGMQISLADARGKIDKAIESPAVMGEVMRRLSADDQRQFLGDVNKAIGDMPASLEEKTAKFLNINHVAMTSAKKGNATAILAEVFATVSPEALTVINEQFAIDLMNRAANPNVTYTDEQYTKLAVAAMQKINERTEETGNGAPRSVFAILMFIRASNGTPADLADKLIDTLKHDDAKELARDEWVPAALGKDGKTLGYESLLAAADAGRRPDFAYVLVIAGPQHLDAVLADIAGKNTDQYAFMRTRTPVLDAIANPLFHQIPTLHDEPFSDDPMPPPEEAGPYPFQLTTGSLHR